MEKDEVLKLEAIFDRLVDRVLNPSDWAGVDYYECEKATAIDATVELLRGKAGLERAKPHFRKFAPDDLHR